MTDAADTYKQLDTFMKVYEESLAEAVVKYPDDYKYPVSEAPAVAVKMRQAILTNTYNHDSKGFKIATKKLGIKHTRKAIEAFIGIRRAPGS